MDEQATPLTTDNPRGGLDVHFDLRDPVALQRSPMWRSGGREIGFLRLAPGRTLGLPPGEHYVKVILGELVSPPRTCLAGPFEVRSTRVECDAVTAGDEGALLALVTLDEAAPRRIASMSLLTFDGPQANVLRWQTFEQRFAGRIDYFNGLDCFMADGFHLLDEHAAEVAYVNPWTCGQGVDLSTHNHGHAPSPQAPAFAEVHWVLAAAAADSGMYTTGAPGDAARTRYPMTLGDEHGPFYDRDASGRPSMLPNGAVQYPWHGWQGGMDGAHAATYDFVLAFEIDPLRIDACV